MNAELESLALPELVDRLHDLDGRRTPVGWTPDDAVERAGIERRILALVAASPAGIGSVLPCSMEIQLRSKAQSQPALVREFGGGGIYIEVPGTWVPGTHVDMYVKQSASDEHGLRVRGVISRVDAGDVRVSVSEQTILPAM